MVFNVLSNPNHSRVLWFWDNAGTKRGGEPGLDRNQPQLKYPYIYINVRNPVCACFAPKKANINNSC